MGCFVDQIDEIDELTDMSFKFLKDFFSNLAQITVGQRVFFLCKFFDGTPTDNAHILIYICRLRSLKSQ